MRSSQKRILVIVIVIAIAVASLITYYVQFQPKQSSQPQKVNFMMDVFIYGVHSIFYPAISEGYYAKEGISVSIVPGQGSYATAQAVGSGAATFGYAGTSAAMLAISKGVPIKIVGMINDYSPCAILTLNSSGIQSPRDLDGKIIGGNWGAGACEPFFQGFAQQVGINISTITEVTLSVPTELSALLSGKVDAVVGFSSALVLWTQQVTAQGKQLLSFNWSSYGFDNYGNAIIVNSETLTRNPTLVSQFLSATYEGILWAYKNQTAAAHLFSSYNPGSTENYSVTLSLVNWVFGLWNKTLIGEALSTNSSTVLGLMTQSEMGNTLSWAVTYENMTSFPVQEAYTNQFLTTS